MRFPSRVGVIRVALALFAIALVGKAAHVQLWQGKQWAARAERQHFAASDLPAPRGDILDARGLTLVQSRELVQLRIAPREVREPRVLSRALVRAGVSADWAKRAVDRKRAWVELPGRYLPSDIAPVAAMRGVYATPVLERVLAAAAAGTRRIVGRVGPDGEPVDGVELALDRILKGEQGTATVLRDARGRRFESPTAPGTAARPGNSVTLTINYALQDICERALADATASMQASGGDIVVMDPHTGAVLAMASRREDPRVLSSTALTEPFEPGSTLKPFIAAKLLTLGRATADEVVNTHNGSWTLDGRTISDSHKAPSMSLTEVIMQSSNIGIVQFAQRLTPREEFEALRDAGFGTPTGVPYPVDAAGTLREPKLWSRTSAASLAMGYEIAVTPLQLVTAYASIANGGELLEPALVKEIRSPDGDVVFRQKRRVVRRLMPEQVAAQIRTMLAQTVSKGTAVEADLATFDVAGKTGTARRTGAGGTGYQARSYTATFVGLFPAQEPQYVILVKLDNPSGAYYGGRTAAPVSKVVLEAAIAARDAALDRGALASRAHVPRPDDSAATARRGVRVAAMAAEDSSQRAAADLADTSAAPGRLAFVVNLGEPPQPVQQIVGVRLVPDVRGLPLRSAVRALHAAGFRVQLAVGASATLPAAGASVAPGSTVRLFHEP